MSIAEWIEDAAQTDSPPPAVVMHHYTRPPRPVQVQIAHNSRGYTWEISYAGDDVDDVLAVIADADRKLRRQYGLAK